MQNGFHDEKLKGRESKVQDKMVETEKTSCQEVFREEVTKILGGKDGLFDECNKTVEKLKKTAETVLGVTFGK